MLMDSDGSTANRGVGNAVAYGVSSTEEPLSKAKTQQQHQRAPQGLCSDFARTLKRDELENHPPLCLGRTNFYCRHPVDTCCDREPHQSRSSRLP